MSPDDLASQIIELARLGWQRGYLSASDGNISARLDNDRLLITPTGVGTVFMNPDDLVEVDLDGQVISAQGRKPSGELALHLAAYRARPSARVVLHAHPPYACALAQAGRDFDCSAQPEMLYHLGSVPTVPYATPASPDIVAQVEPFLAEHRALLLDHHGTLTVGRDLAQAFVLTEMLEHGARVLAIGDNLGGATPLPMDEQERLRALSSGQEKPPLPSLAERLQHKHLALSSEFLTEKRAEDGRGEVHLIADGILARKVALLELKPGTGYRGGHRHQIKTEWFYVAKGSCQAQFVCHSSGERLEMRLSEGDRVRIPPGVAHRFMALEPLQFVEMADRPYQGEDDIPFDFPEAD